jgi:hypothetical protein
MLIEILRSALPQLGRCRGCEAPIEWAETPKGHRMPVDHPLRVVRTYARLDGTVVTVIESASTHWASCPQSAAFHRAIRGTGYRGRR